MVVWFNFLKTNIWTEVFWVMILCSLVGEYKCFRVTYTLKTDTVRPSVTLVTTCEKDYMASQSTQQSKFLPS